ncbi:MAG: geranylgeranylglycerol-phosphate geranylgeranyltransferase [Chitinophagaceae bacterium]|jgi:4-hydroxybenzoate polyprenyltransferase|nr:geranylgeranylglycerol-phosphate geranylgeranyltransferase [Chitinophagaceae bacterium]
MRLIAAFFQLIRLPNLFFIALTQTLFQYCIFYPLFRGEMPAGDNKQFILLVIASVLIAAAGYIINDYFDVNIDQVNKPDKIVVDKLIHRRWAIAWHMILSVSGIILTALALPLLQKWYLVLGNILVVILLWFYSTTYKKSVLIGNVIIALLTAWTILIIYFSKIDISDVFAAADLERQAKFFRLTVLYASFAFIISLVREAIKDMEDMTGDARYNCLTMPIAWGINATKIYVAVWLIVLVLMLLIIQAYILPYGWWLPAIFCILLIIYPLVNIFYRLFKSYTQHEFHNLSNRTKFVMLTGILSMIFFGIYL